MVCDETLQVLCSKKGLVWCVVNILVGAGLGAGLALLSFPELSREGGELSVLGFFFLASSALWLLAVISQVLYFCLCWPGCCDTDKNAA